MPDGAYQSTNSKWRIVGLLKLIVSHEKIRLNLVPVKDLLSEIC